MLALVPLGIIVLFAIYGFLRGNHRNSEAWQVIEMIGLITYLVFAGLLALGWLLKQAHLI